MIDFNNPSALAAAQAHVASLRWRLAVGGVFALGAAFVLGSLPIAFGWFLAFALATGFDAMLGHAFLDARGARDRVRTGAMFLWGCAFSVLVLMGLTLGVAAAGGGAGKVLAACMAASALVGVMLFLYQAPGFLLVTAAPAALCLFLAPFIGSAAAAANERTAALGAACGVWALLAYIARAARHNAETTSGLKAANAEARHRQGEAEMRRAEAEAAHLAKSKFLAAMTHQLRTPLNAVIGYAELLREDMAGAGNSSAAHDADRIEYSARRLLHMIDQILHIASDDAGRESVNARAFDVRALLEGVLADHVDAARAAGNRVTLRVSEAAASATTDPDKLAACLDALVSNAVKFTREGAIALSAEACVQDGQDWLIICVADTGEGIAARDLASLFTPFAQAATEGHGGGVGLGLAIAQRMARAIGGDLEVESKRGEGSRFTVRAPLRLGTSQAEARSANAA